jgi:hypothetical protein
LAAAFLKQIHQVHNMHTLHPTAEPITTKQFSSAFHRYRVVTHRLYSLDSLVSAITGIQQQQDFFGDCGVCSEQGEILALLRAYSWIPGLCGLSYIISCLGCVAGFACR